MSGEESARSATNSDHYGKYELTIMRLRMLLASDPVLWGYLDTEVLP